MGWWWIRWKNNERVCKPEASVVKLSHGWWYWKSKKLDSVQIMSREHESMSTQLWIEKLCKTKSLRYLPSKKLNIMINFCEVTEENTLKQNLH